MEQMKIDPAQVVQMDMEGAASVLHPVVFHEGDGYCRLLGSDPVKGVMGRGVTPEEALQDWDERLKDYLADAGLDDEIVMHVKSIVFGANPIPEKRN